MQTEHAIIMKSRCDQALSGLTSAGLRRTSFQRNLFALETSTSEAAIHRIDLHALQSGAELPGTLILI